MSSGKMVAVSLDKTCICGGIRMSEGDCHATKYHNKPGDYSKNFPKKLTY